MTKALFRLALGSLEALFYKLSSSRLKKKIVWINKIDRLFEYIEFFYFIRAIK